MSAFKSDDIEKDFKNNEPVSNALQNMMPEEIQQVKVKKRLVIMRQAEPDESSEDSPKELFIDIPKIDKQGEMKLTQPELDGFFNAKIII